jgi:transcriptional regulator with XRE-family HTH domain|nr:MAG TPA: Helix-turn-helix XRE-family like protein [Caudoviricetes sp.]
MNERERIGQRIAELRKEQGISQAKLSELTGIGSGHIARIELGKYSIGIDTLAKIAEILEYKIDFVKK